jgi:hypothetical protein
MVAKAQGLDNAQEMLMMLNKLGSNIMGISLKADSRDSGANNAAIINYLAGKHADGSDSESHKGPIRDIRPTEDDSDAAAAQFLEKVENRLRLIAKKKRLAKTAAQRATLEKLAKNAADEASRTGFRAAGKLIVKILSDRVESNAYEPPTSEEYARRRQNLYGISPGVSLRASGRLLRNLQGGRLKLFTKQTLGAQFESFLSQII